MKCPRCQAENRETRKFCGKCGASLAVKCPQCGSENLSGEDFCGECGRDLRAHGEAPPVDYNQPHSYTPRFLAEKILTTRSALEGERKLVTVLFADVANYTAMSERLDPEEVHGIMDGCFKILMDEIHKYEGTINQFTGDGVMALFGAPVSHEDHAQRACYAALAIQRGLKEFGDRINRMHGIQFQMRIGLNSGPVIVGRIGDDLRMDYTAVGDTTNLAARIQQAAAPGEIWMSRETRGIVQDYFRDESMGEVTLKGKAEPQPIYRLVSERPGVRTRFEAGLVRGVTELVGRRTEMETLRSAFERAQGGEAQVVDVVGEAGVGKSRLVYEFQKGLGKEATFHMGISLHYGRNINFLPLIDIIKGAFGIEEGMTEGEAGRRIEERAQGSLVPFIPFYRNLLSLKVEDAKFNALNPEGRKFGTFEAAKSLLFSLSEKKPLVVFLEDVHWIDKISEEFFTFFSRCIHGHPVMMLSAYRPEATPSWAQGAHYQKLGLETLSMKSSIRLVGNILGGWKLEPALEGTIAEKAGGNPFFMEEIVRELLERGDLVREENRYICRRPIDELEIPSTIHGVIAARMDRLSEDLKRTMQVASVIGRDFAFRLLKSIMELGEELRGHLTNLVGIEVLYEKALYPELEYIFKHALTQEVAYESLLKQRRREIHGRIARAIEELYADKLEQHYEILAHHWELSDTPERAIEYLVLAGEKSNQSQAASAAVDFFTRALIQVEKRGGALDQRLLMRIRKGRANPLHVMGRIEDSFGDYQEAIRLGREFRDDQTVLECLSTVPWLLYNTTLKDQVPQICEQALDLARALGDKGAQARIMLYHAYWRYLWQLTNEYETFERAFQLAQESANPMALIAVRGLMVVMERWRGNPRRSLEHSEGLIENLEGVFNNYYAGAFSYIRGWALTDLGRYSEAIEFLKRWADILEQNSIYLGLGRCWNSLGWTYSEIYNLQRALDMNNRSLENAVRLRGSPAMVYSASEMQAMAEVNLMENKYEMGRVEAACEHLSRFKEVSQDPFYHLQRDRWGTRMMDLRGNILLRQGDLGGAEQLAKECLAVASRRSHKKYVAKAERLLGEVMTKRGAHAQAEEFLKTALQKLEEVENPKQLWLTRTALARLYERMNRPDLEREQWQAAAAIVRSTADGLKDEALRRTFLDAAPIREISAKAV